MTDNEDDARSNSNSTISALLVEPLLLSNDAAVRGENINRNDPFHSYDHRRPESNTVGCTAVARTDILPVVRDARLVLDASGRRVRQPARMMWCSHTARRYYRRLGIVLGLLLAAFVFIFYTALLVQPPPEDSLPDMDDNDDTNAAFLQRQQKIVTFLQLVTLDQQKKNLHATDPIIQDILLNTTFTLPDDANDLIEYYGLATVRQVADVYRTNDDDGTFLAARGAAHDKDPSQAAAAATELPADIGLLTQLQHLQLRGWSGTVPSVLGRLTNLQVIDLSFNAWQGPIPDAWQSWKSAEIVWFTGSTGVTGYIPDAWCDEGSTRSLQVLDISQTELVLPALCAERFTVESPLGSETERATVDGM